MTNLMHTCFILQYVHYNPLHVLLTAHLSINLDNDQLDAHLALFYSTSTTVLYMFRALVAHHQEVNCIDAASGIVLSDSDRTATD